jgi:hypothetical protein
VSDRAPTYRLKPDFNRKLTAFAERFLADGFDLFADEFANLDGFIARALSETTDRNDTSLRQTPREKYLIEAVAYKIYDTLNREAFNKAKQTLIVLPDCLSLHNPDCLKTDEPYGDRCQQCSDACQASEVVDLADEYGVEVVFSKRKLGEQIAHFRERSSSLGVIGIGCMLMLAEGMRTASDEGVPTRGVLLDFCGCEHWNDVPFASAFPLDQLRSILKEKYG